MGERRRLFFALWPEASARRQLVKLQKCLPDHHGRPVHPEDLHITLAFLGGLDAAAQACCEALGDGMRAPVFALSLDRTGLFLRSRILWCGPGKTPPALLGLVEALQRGLKRCGLEPERRPYRPHVTLARDARAMETGPLEEPVCLYCDRFVLAQSLSVRDPPRYRVVREWPLGGS